jgi:hypothetical protein
VLQFPASPPAFDLTPQRGSIGFYARRHVHRDNTKRAHELVFVNGHGFVPEAEASRISAARQSDPWPARGVLI